jgi:hypothetical protein
MLPRVFPEGTSRKGGARHCREVPGLDAALPRARHMDPKASSTRDQPASGMSRGAERRFAGGGNFGEVGAGGNLSETDT